MSLSIEMPIPRLSVAPSTEPYTAGDLGRMLFEQYAGSVHGEWQAAQPLRYAARFGCYGREQMLADFGDDVHPVLHMPETVQSLLRLVEQERKSGDWSPEDIDVALTAAWLHDIGECTYPELIFTCGAVVGDLAQDTKTDKHKADEARVREEMRCLYYPDIPGMYMDRVEAIIAHREKSRIHHAFEAAHDINTFHVGLRAGELALSTFETSYTDIVRAQQLRLMAKLVTGAASERVERHAATFTYADIVLQNTEPLRERMQQLVA